MGNENYEVTVDGSGARRELDSIIKRMRDLGSQATASGAVVDKSVAQEAKNLASLAGSYGVVERAAAQTARAEAAAAAARSRAQTAASGAAIAGVRASSAGAISANQVRTSSSVADLAGERVSTEQVRQRVTLREQENKNLIAAGRLSVINGQLEDQQTARVERASAAQLRALKEQQRATIALQATERSRAVQAERNARAIASGATNERTSALSAERSQNPLGDVNQINATRYALYDVATTAAVAGAAVASVGVASIVAATQYQSEFQEVVRISELSGASIQNVRNDLLELTETMPTDFAAVTQIAAIGGQMNIAEEDLASFTETISQFAATTNVSVDTAALSFGRISNLLDVNPADFDKLGSSIYEVGIKSVATESEILSTTQQIAGAAAAYNFAAQDVVGLGAAFASLAIAPEAARGSVTRIFGDIEKAVAEGGDALTEYARISGLTAEEITTMWDEDPSGFFQSLINGLSQSKTLIQDISAIGANDVRDQNLLQRLAGNPELLQNSLGIANQAFNEGTALAEGYATSIDTLSAKLQIMLNGIKSLAAAAGAPLLGPLGLAVDLISALVGLLQGNPILTGIIVGISLLVGGLILAKGAIAATMAGLLAMKFVMDQLAETTGVTGINLRSLGAISSAVAKQFGVTGISVGTLTARLREMDVAAASAGRSQSALRGAAQGTATALRGAEGAFVAFGKATLVLGAITIATQLLSKGLDLLQAQFASAGDKAATYFGDTSGFSAAVADDTKAFNDTGDAIATYARSTKEAGLAAVDSSDSVGTWLGLQAQVADTTNEATAATTDQTFALGENAKAWVQNALSQQEGIKNFANNPDLVAGFKDLGGSIDEFLNASLQGTGTQYVNNLAAQAEQKAAELEAQAAATSDRLEGNKLALRAADYRSLGADIQNTLKPATDAVDNLAEAEKESANTSEFLGEKIADTGDAADEAAGEVSSLSDQLDALFGNVDSSAAFADSMQKLFSGIYDGGASFNYLDETGRTNLSNLRAAMEDTINYGATLGLSASESLQGLFSELEAKGVDTANLLQQLGIDPITFTADADVAPALAKLNQVRQVADGIYKFGQGPLKSAAAPANVAAKSTESLSGGMKSLVGNMREVARVAPRASKGISGTGDSAKKAAAKVVTLNDYVSDLQKVFNDADQYRFGMQDALDDVDKQWIAIAKQIEDNKADMAEAAEKVRDYTIEIQKLRAEIQGLQAGLSQKKYFLDVAIRYGDTLRGDEISADIAKDQADIADKLAELADKSSEQSDAQAKLGSATDKSSLSFLEQREELSNLYKGYEQIILEYARSGASQAQVAAKTEELRQRFVQQATQMGYSRSEVDRFSNAFSGLITIINQVPRNVTVSVNADPALRALADFRAKADQASAAISGLRNNAAAPIPSPTFDDTGAKKNARLATLQAALASAQRDLDRGIKSGADNVAQRAMDRVNQLSATINSGNYAAGGFVPGARPQDRSRDNMVGQINGGGTVGLQGGEPIMTNAARSKYGDDMFEQINALKFKPQMVTPTVVVQGGGGEGLTYLSAQDRLLLEQIRDTIGLNITGNALQKAVGAANRTGSIRKDS